MSPQETGTSALSVGDIVVMNGMALAEVMLNNRGPDGNFSLPVDSCDRLSKDKRASLAERLMGALLLSSIFYGTKAEFLTH